MQDTVDAFSRGANCIEVAEVGLHEALLFAEGINGECAKIRPVIRIVFIGECAGEIYNEPIGGREHLVMSDLFDLVIRGGTVVDGTGASAYAGDVAISDGRIAEVGQVTGAGREEIDATDRIVIPGFVDVHTHYDAQVTWANQILPSSANGVTTVLMGNCGVGFATSPPGSSRHAD